MSAGYLLGLAAVVAVILSARLSVGLLPLHGVGARISRVAAAVASVGIVGLIFHCGAMFFPSVVGGLPGTHRAIDDIDALGAVSRIWYIAATALVLIGLRCQHLIARVIVALSLLAVGITMYDGGALWTHLTAIFVAVVILAGVAAVLVLPPPPTRRRGLRRASA